MSSEKARLLYFKLWTLHIDSRALMARGVSLPVPEQKKAGQNGKRKVRAGPGMFFRLDDGGVVMVMGREEVGRKGDGDGDAEKRYVCAAVNEVGDGAYELFVKEQKVVAGGKLVDEIVLEYSREDRYYHMKAKSDSD